MKLIALGRSLNQPLERAASLLPTALYCCILNLNLLCLKANKLACSIHGCWQKTNDTLRTETKDCYNIIKSMSISIFAGSSP